MNCHASKAEISQLKDQLYKNKIFLSMVIHDMRNPTSSIKSGLQHSLLKIREIENIYKDHIKINKMSKELIMKIKDDP